MALKLPHLWSRFSDKFFMKSSVQFLVLMFVALSGLSLGYLQGPFSSKKEIVMSKEESQKIREKAHFYFLMKNYQGALDLTAAVPASAPDYQQIQIIRRMAQYKIKKNMGNPVSASQPWDYHSYPAAVRDSLFDSLYASSEGHCLEAYKHMQVVDKYTNVVYNDWIYNNCKETRDKRQPASERALKILKVDVKARVPTQKSGSEN